MAAREAELLPIPYFHVVFTLPSAIGDIAYQNKAVIYDLLFKASSETMLRIAADPKHLGARINAPEWPRLNTAKHNVLIGNALVIRAVKWT